MDQHLPIAVATHVSAPSWMVAAFTGLTGSLFGGALVTWIKSRPKLLEIEKTHDEGLIATLSARVDKLETDLKEQREHYERKIDSIQVNYDADQRVARHALNNVKMRFRALVMLLKRMPDPPPMLIAILADIEEMEAEQTQAEALEKGAQSGAKIIATSSPTSKPAGASI